MHVKPISPQANLKTLRIQLEHQSEGHVITVLAKAHLVCLYFYIRTATNVVQIVRVRYSSYFRTQKLITTARLN